MSSEQVHETKIRVRYAEVDQMGIAHHSQHIHWLEIGRVEFLRNLGYRYRDLEDQNILLSVIEANCKYRYPARYDEIITVKTWLTEVGRVKLKFDYTIHSEEGKLIAEASITLGCINRAARPQRIPEDVRLRLQKAMTPSE